MKSKGIYEDLYDMLTDYYHKLYYSVMGNWFRARRKSVYEQICAFGLNLFHLPQSQKPFRHCRVSAYWRKIRILVSVDCVETLGTIFCSLASMTGPYNCLSNFTVINYACWRSNITEIDIVWEVSRELKLCKCIFGWPLTCLMFSCFFQWHRSSRLIGEEVPQTICDRGVLSDWG